MLITLGWVCIIVAVILIILGYTAAPPALRPGWGVLILGVVLLLIGYLLPALTTRGTYDDPSAKRHSCGFHCNPDGSDATPAAPPAAPSDDNADGVIDGTIQPAGRTNVHSGGHGEKRHGGGGRNNPHDADIIIGNSAGVQPFGRTINNQLATAGH